MMRRPQTVKTRFQTLEIWKSDDSTEFRVAGAVHAWHARGRFLTGQAWDLIAAAPLLLPSGRPRSVLMLGLAGGTAFRTLRHLLPDCDLTAVDIDAEIVDQAREHMALDECGAEVIIADAYQWLARNRRRFDVVIDDLYLAGKDDVFRARDADRDAMALLRKAVGKDGLLAMNLVMGPGHRRVQSAARSMFRKSFPAVRSLRTEEALNEVLVAGGSLATAKALRSYQNAFIHPLDQDYWQRIKVVPIG